MNHQPEFRCSNNKIFFHNYSYSFEKVWNLQQFCCSCCHTKKRNTKNKGKT